MNIVRELTQKSYSPNGEYDSLGSFQKKSVYRVLIFVIAIHACIVVLVTFGLPDFKFNKRPDITIEIGVAPPASSGPVSAIKPESKPATTPKGVLKEKTPISSNDKDAPVVPLPSEVGPSTNQAALPHSGGVAAAPTADADYKAAYLQNPKPPYPPLAFKARVEGKVTLIAQVLPDGRAGQVRILESSGNEMLDQSALTTVKQWKFTPARKDGVIVTQAVRIPITFSLKNR